MGSILVEKGSTMYQSNALTLSMVVLSRGQPRGLKQPNQKGISAGGEGGSEAGVPATRLRASVYLNGWRGGAKGHKE